MGIRLLRPIQMTAVVAMASLVLSLAACSITQSVVAIDAVDKTIKSPASSSVSDGYLSTTYGTMTCGGEYDATSKWRAISVQLLCSDGRKGFATASRDSGTGGHGTAKLDDGTEWKFIFGP